jgi:hypothetical protein
MSAPQSVLQWPPVQSCPAGHALPHAPQFALSVSSDTHCPSHAVCRAGHDTSQCPIAQT